MPHIAVYGREKHVAAVRDVLHEQLVECLATAWEIAPDQIFIRFIGLADTDFRYSDSYGERFTYIELIAFEGRPVARRREFLRLLYDRVPAACGIPPTDLEIMMHETPRHDGGVGGRPA
ncbi:tautomerase family protein [Actinosynnema sp. NPDC050436]|uniref:tautomerase family protein n=1 Tax=Actinosynnema sp. NPDC050436 TaxID=3155659 RepID=UPI0033F4A9E6